MPVKKSQPTGRTIKYNAGCVAFICDHIEDGMTLAEICRKFPSEVPTEKMVYTWKKKYPDFAVKFHEAYSVFFYKKIDEYELLSKEAMELQRLIEDAEKLI